jgi:hypothetical protein
MTADTRDCDVSLKACIVSHRHIGADRNSILEARISKDLTFFGSTQRLLYKADYSSAVDSVNLWITLESVGVQLRITRTNGHGAVLGNIAR